VPGRALRFALFVVGMIRVPYERDFGNSRSRFFESLQALGRELVLQQRDAGRIPARPAETLDEAELLRIGAA
jgi:hypothetical protein